VKSVFIVPLIILGLTSVTAQTLTSLPTPDNDPFVGSWLVNANKSKPKPEDASYARTIARDGDELVFTSLSPLLGGAVHQNQYKILCDGQPRRVPCGQGSCITSCIYKAENLVEGETKSTDGKSYWTREVSADHQEMTISGYKDKAKTKLKTTQVLDRTN
jgi:hypothetical protein